MSPSAAPEGLACGCLPLASNDADAVWPAGLLFRLGDQADITEKIRILTQDNVLLSQLRSQAQCYLSQFNSDVTFDHYMVLTEGIVNYRC